MTQKEITVQLSASGRTVRLWLAALRRSGKVVSVWGDDLRVPLYSISRFVSREAV